MLKRSFPGWSKLFLGLLILAGLPTAPIVAAGPMICGNQAVGGCEDLSPPSGQSPSDPPEAPPDLVVSGCCRVRPLQTGAPPFYAFRYVNVVDQGALQFDDSPGTIDFRVSGLLIEQGGVVEAGSPEAPFGRGGGKLLLGLWGDDPTAEGMIESPADSGIDCVGNGGRCYSEDLTSMPHCCTEGTDDPCSNQACPKTNYNALFEGYKDLMFDPNPFGYKVLAVSYGGSLELFGDKGVASPDEESILSCPSPADAKPFDEKNQYDVDKWAQLSEKSWVRLAADVDGGSNQLVLDRGVDWEEGDRLVVSTTDWHPGHSELVTIGSAEAETGASIHLVDPLIYPHRGSTYELPPPVFSDNPNREVDLRAAVGLLTRDIVIRSLGKTAADDFPAASECGVDSSRPECYFGGHVIVRQGFKTFQLQGVELYQLGQGGRMGHYPIHFHLAKSTGYTDAFVKDCSIWDSNTRFVTIHGTHDTTVARNVGYLSVGHGYFLEDASEINNLLCQNLGVSARATTEEYLGVQDSSSPTHRKVPPIIDSTFYEKVPPPRPLPDDWRPPPQTIAGSDNLFPSMFWIMNAQNELVGNLAAGTGGWGACYWLLGSGLSGASEHLEWSQEVESAQIYAGFNLAGGRNAPLLRFRNNACVSAAYGLMTELASVPPGAAQPKNQDQPPPVTYSFSALNPIQNVYDIPNEMRPKIKGNFNATRYGENNPSCNNSEGVGQEGLAGNVTNCVTTIIDRFTTSFNWAEVNLGSVWLRPKHFLFMNGAVTDQLFGGLGFVSGGSWDQAPPGYFSLTKNSSFIGTSRSRDQDTACAFDSEKGPDITHSSPMGTCAVSRCQHGVEKKDQDPFCYFDQDGTGVYTGGFNPKRMITIYDGPFFAEGNQFLATEPFECSPGDDSNDTRKKGCGIYLGTNQPYLPDGAPPAAGSPVRKEDKMKVINAAIGWKQPNIFYYPPAFAFIKSDFDKDTERHNVFDQKVRYVQGNTSGVGIQMPLLEFGGITLVDFTTILNDLDGTLTGLVAANTVRTSSVSTNDFFSAPSQTPECQSFGVQTSPYEFVTTVMAQLSPKVPPDTFFKIDPKWAENHQPAIPIYRHQRLPGDTCSADPVCSGEKFGCDRGAFMMGTQTGQAPFLTANNGIYYLDTDRQDTSCVGSEDYKSPGFDPGGQYVVYNLFAKPEIKSTYQIYVGGEFGPEDFSWARIFPHRHSTVHGLEILVEDAPTDDPPYGTYCHDTSTGLLTVTVDSSSVASDFGFSSPKRESYEKCIPRDLCQVDDGAGKCVLCTEGQCTQGVPEDDYKSSLGEICESWVTVTSGVGGQDTGPVTGSGDGHRIFDGIYLADCPAGGCLGFRFQLPETFSPKAYSAVKASLIQPDCFPAAEWKVALTRLPGEEVCFAPREPGTDNFCRDEVPVTCPSSSLGGITSPDGDFQTR